VKRFLARVIGGATLGEAEAAEAMALIMEGEATPAQIGAFLAALAVRGESEDEIVGFARAMRERALPVRSQGAVDTCGTGGDGAGTFNISTLASFVVAAAGVPVAKHGNRSASGHCGSADVLEALGVRPDPPLAVVQRSLDELGWAFLFAPTFHLSTRHAVGPRKEMGVRTAFNLLGPLTNPARPRAQVVGVARPELAEFLAGCLGRLGVERAWVVHGSGLDELSLAGPSLVAALGEDGVSVFEVAPEDAGVARADTATLEGGDAEASARIVREVLGGACGPQRDVVLLNAAAALVVAGHAADLREGAAQAAEAIDAGLAVRLLDQVRELSRA
jgi:anthranilate phosphoribosyltransferase